MKIRDINCDIDLPDYCPDCKEISINAVATEYYCDDGGISYISFICPECGYMYDDYESIEECVDSVITDSQTFRIHERYAICCYKCDVITEERNLNPKTGFCSKCDIKKKNPISFLMI